MRPLQYIYEGQAAIDLIDNSEVLDDDVERVMMGDDYFAFGYEKWKIGNLLGCCSRRMRMGLILTFFNILFGGNMLNATLRTLFQSLDGRVSGLFLRLLMVGLIIVALVSVYSSFWLVRRFKRRVILTASNTVLSLSTISIGVVVLIHDDEFLSIGLFTCVYQVAKQIVEVQGMFA